MGTSKNAQFFVEDGGHHSSATPNSELQQELAEVKRQALRYKTDLDAVKRNVHLMMHEVHRVKQDYRTLQFWSGWLKTGLTVSTACLVLGASSGLFGEISWATLFTHDRVNLVTR